MFIGQKIKSEYINTWFKSTIQNVSKNDYSGQASKIAMLCSFDGIVSFIYSIIGKWFGICCSTVMLVSLGIWGILKDLYLQIKNIRKKGQKIIVIEVYCLLSFLACFGMNCIFLIDPENYADYIIYTRYTENAVLPIIFYGIYRLVERKVGIKEAVINVIILVSSLMLVIYRAGNVGATNYVGQGNIAIWDMYKSGMSVSLFMEKVAIRSLIIFAIIFIVSYWKWNKKIILGIVALFWLGVTVNVYQKDYNVRKNNDISNIAKIINNVDTSDTLYYYIGEEKNATVTAFYLQLMDADRKITILKSWEDVENIPDGSYILTNGISDITLKEKDNYIIIDKSWRYALIEKNVKSKKIGDNSEHFITWSSGIYRY